MTYHRFFLIIALIMACAPYAHGQEKVNVQAKERAMRKLLRRGVAFLKRNTIGEACHAFTRSPSWREGELFLFLLDEEGTCYTFGDERSRIWTSFADYKDSVGTPLIKRFASQQKLKSIAVTLNNAPMHILMRRVSKDGKTFFLGCGFYPEAVEYILENLVERAISVLNEIGITNGFSEINNPWGHFVNGDSYVFVIGQDGVTYAQGGNVPQIGKSIFNPPLEPPDSPIFEEKEATRHVLIEFLKSNEQRAWLPPVTFNNTVRRMFVVKYKDPTTHKSFIVGSFYFPELNDDAIYSLVQKGITYLKAQGNRAAFDEIAKPMGPLSLGTGRIMVLDFDGMVLADGSCSNYVGYNMIDRSDAQGHFTFRRLIEDVEQYGRAWISQYLKNSYQLIYAEKVDLPDGPLIVAAGYWPNSKGLTARSMVDRATSFLSRHGQGVALEKFTSFDSDFLRGDVNILALDPAGIILGDGPYRKHVIWSDVELRDQFGRLVIDKILETAARGGGWVGFRKFNAEYKAYAQQVTFDTGPTQKRQSMILAAGYYL